MSHAKCMLLVFALSLQLLTYNCIARPNIQSSIVSKQQKLKLQQTLYRSVEVGKISSVRELLKKGVDADTVYRDGETLLMLSVIHGHFSIASLLISYGTAVNRTDIFGNTAVNYAVLNNRLSILQHLLKHGASVDPVNHSEPPLVVAADVGAIGMLNTLLKANANVNARNRRGDTAIIAAVGHCNLSAVRLLLGSKANIHLKNKNGEDALSIAKKERCTSLVEILE